MEGLDRGWRRGGAPALVRCLLAVVVVLGGLGLVGGSSPAGAAVQGRVRLVRQTSWVAPGETLTLAMRTADIVDPSALELAVTVHPAVKTRVDLARTMAGDGLGAPLGARPSAAVPLPEIPTTVDGTLNVQVPTQGPGTPQDPARIRLPRAGIYPVQVELRELGGGDTVDRFTTHLLAVAAPADGSRLGAAVVLPLSAPPSTGLDGVSGPPAGASALADAAAGLSAAADVPLTLAPTPEVLESLAAADPTTATALKQALADRDVLGRPYVPVDLPALGAAAAPLLPQQLSAGRDAARAVLGREPMAGIWVADEPLDGAALAQVVATGAPRVVLPQSAVGPTGAAVAPPLRPVTVTAEATEVTATALVADATLARELDGRGAPLDQPLIAHHLLADLAALATLPPEQGRPAPEGPLDRGVATVLAARTFTPTSGFLTELLGGLAASPVLRAVDLAGAFSITPEPPAPVPSPTTSARSRRGTTTTVRRAAPGRTLVPLPPGAAGAGVGDVAAEAVWQLATHEQVLSEPAPVEPGSPPSSATGQDGAVVGGGRLQRRLLVATSADLPVEQQRARLEALGRTAKADLAALKVPENRNLRLTARTGQLPVGVVNETGRTARVLLQLDSEKLEFPDGNTAPVVLDRRSTTEPVRVRVRASGSFPVKVRLLTPDGGRVLHEAEYVVRANTVPGVAIAVSGAAAVFLAGWWAKTLLPERRHLRRRRHRRARHPG